MGQSSIFGFALGVDNWPMPHSDVQLLGMEGLLGKHQSAAVQNMIPLYVMLGLRKEKF